MHYTTFIAAAALAACASAAPTVQETSFVSDTYISPIIDCIPPPTPEPSPAPSPKPSPKPVNKDELKTFGIVSIRSGSNLQYASWSATLGGLFVGVNQSANCFGKESSFATFQLNTTSQQLFMYNTTEISKQIVYTDRSGMGQGVLQYTDGISSTSGGTTKIEDSGFAINSTTHNLQFKGSDFIACPLNDLETEFKIWVDTGVQNPGHSSRNCTGILAKVSEVTEPIGCLYNTTGAGGA